MLILFIIVMTLLVSMIPWLIHHGLPFSGRSSSHQKFNFYRKDLQRSPARDDIVAPVFDFDIDEIDSARGEAEPHRPPDEDCG